MKRAWIAFALTQKDTVIKGTIEDYGVPPPGSKCFLCSSRNMSNAVILGVAPPMGAVMGTNMVVCGKCVASAINQFEQSGAVVPVADVSSPKISINQPAYESLW